MYPSQQLTFSDASKKYPNLPSTLFVNNIDPNIDKSTLSNLFCRYGTVMSVSLTKESSKGYAYVIFSEIKHAELALQKLQYNKLGKYEIVLMFAAQKSQLKPEGKIFIKNIPERVSHSELHNLFAFISPELVVHIAYDEKHKNSLLYGYAHYFNPQDAKDAILNLQGYQLEGSKLELSPWVVKDVRHQQLPEKKNLYVGNLPDVNKDLLENGVRTLFKHFGQIDSILLKKSDKSSYYSALVSFKSTKDAENAYDSLSAYPRTILGSSEPIIINWHQTREERTKERHKEGNRDNLYVRNLRMDINEQEIRQLFGMYGEIKDIELRTWTAPNGRNEAQFAFVSYKDPDDAAKALDEAPDSEVIQELFLSRDKVYIRFFMPKNEREEEVKKVNHARRGQQQPIKKKPSGSYKPHKPMDSAPIRDEVMIEYVKPPLIPVDGPSYRPYEPGVALDGNMIFESPSVQKPNAKLEETRFNSWADVERRIEEIQNSDLNDAKKQALIAEILDKNSDMLT